MTQSTHHHSLDLRHVLETLPQETGIFPVAPGIDVVVHVLNPEPLKQGTLYDVKDLCRHTIYRIRREAEVLMVEVYYSDRLTTDYFTLTSVQVIDAVLELLDLPLPLHN